MGIPPRLALRNDLHWLPIEQRVDFKVDVITYRCMHCTAPEHLSEMFSPVTDDPGCRLFRQLVAVTDFGSLSAFKRTIKYADPSEFLSFTFEYSRPYNVFRIILCVCICIVFNTIMCNVRFRTLRELNYDFL